MAQLYTDHNVAVRVAEILHQSGHEALIARDVGLARAEDDEHLLFAVQQGRTLLTHNRKDFILLHNALCRWSAAWPAQPAPHHFGILVLQQDIGAAELSHAVDSFLASAPYLPNELYRWQQNSGWTRLQTGTRNVWLPYP